MIIPELVDQCNLKCVLCWNRNRIGTGRQMELKTVEKVVQVFGTHRVQNYHWYNFGEPMLYNHFHEFVEIVKKTRSSISSNFSLKLPDQRFEDLAKLEQVTISMSGLTPEVYNIYHQGGNFKLVWENFLRLAEISVKKKRMNFLLHPGNKHQWQQAKDLCEEKGFIWGGLRANCEVEEALQGFTHPFLKTPKMYGSKHLTNCKVQRWRAIDVDGNYLLCCTSHNVKIGLSIWDDVTSEEVWEAKMKQPLCIECHKKQVWRMF